MKTKIALSCRLGTACRRLVGLGFQQSAFSRTVAAVYDRRSFAALIFVTSWCNLPSSIASTNLLSTTLHGVVFSTNAASSSGNTDPLPAVRKLGGTTWAGNVGVPGGIPNRTTIFTNIPPGASLSYVQGAINICPSNQVVMLSTGTYNWVGQGLLAITKSYVTLRGAGLTNTTILCDSKAALIGDANWYNQWQTPTSNRFMAWTGGFTQGTNKITVANGASLTVGNLIFLDQTNDADTTAYSPANSDGPYDIANNNTLTNYSNYLTGEYTSLKFPLKGLDRIQFQVNRVTAINSNVVTLAEPLYMPNWSSNNAPEVWFETDPVITVFSGVEDLKGDVSSGGGEGIGMQYTYGCWVKNCYITGPTQHQGYVAPVMSVRCEIRHCYLKGPGSTDDYGVRTRMVSGMLMEDNIGNGCGTLMMVNGVSGSVYAYNFGINLQAQSSFLTEGLLTHGATPNMNLFEGNWVPAFGLDDQWNNSAYLTAFRNRFTGTNDGPYTLTGNNQPVSIMEMHRHASVIGNILGKIGTHTFYEDIGGTSPCHDNNPEPNVCRVYYLGLREPGQGCSGIYDAQVKATLIRAVNWDTATSGIDSNGHTLADIPASYIYSSKPSNFGICPWPPFDPSKGATIAANFTAYTNIPAGYRYVHGVDP